MEGMIRMIREMRAADWDSVRDIYSCYLEKGTASFLTECPTYEAWDSGHHRDCRFVYEQDGEVLGFVVLLPVSPRPHYSGVAEVSIYIREDCLHRGIGTALLMHMKEAARSHGYWTLYSSIFSVNTASIALHEKCGFRNIGYREKLAKNRFGHWQDTTMMEWRNDLE